MNSLVDPVVLVVDDEPNVIRLCQRFLEKAGYQVIASTSSSQAIAILSRRGVDALLVDIRMPGLDGFQLLTLARRQQPDLAAVIMTGYGTVETAIAALRQGVDGLVLKPFAGAELVESVRQALQESGKKRDVQRLHALRPLFKITEELFKETDLAKLERLIVSLASHYLSSLHAGLLRRKGVSDPFDVISWQGTPLNLESDLLAQELLESTVHNETPFLLNREGPGDPELQAFVAKYKLASMMFVPVLYLDHTNILLVARQENQPFFCKADLEMFAIFARQASLALENALLYAELRSYIVQIEKSQQVMNQAEKMAAAGRLTASIAHEINNPLQSLNNCLHLAGRKELSVNERQKYLEMAQSELDRLMSTVQRMLDYYRPGAKDRKLADVNEIIERVVLLLEPQLKEGNIKVYLELAQKLPMVTVVASQIQQVLINLILNSMEAMPEGGEIYIRTDPCHYDYSTPDDIFSGIEINIEDSGPGIPEDETERIFEPFVSTKEHGTGLGLSVSYGIISAHGGTLSLVRGQGKGACFRIALPNGDVI